MEEVLVFPSTYHMLRSEELLKRKGYALRLVPAPPQAGELCVTAIAISPHDREEIVRYLEGENILIKAVLPHESRLARPLVAALEGIMRRYTLPAALRGIFDAMRDGKQLGTAEVEEMLSRALADGGEAIIAAAEDVSRAYFGGRVTALVGVRVARRGTAGVIDLPDIEATVEEMSRLGFVYTLLDIGELDEVPWPPQDLGKALGDKAIAVISAASLPAEAGMMVRDHGIRQFLRYSSDIFDLDAQGLADEVIFLRDNLPGPVGSGNLLPLLSPDLTGAGDDGAHRVRAVLAVCRLVLGDVFLPAPPALWKARRLAGANLWVLDATGRPLPEAAGEAETYLREMDLVFARVGRGEASMG